MIMIEFKIIEIKPFCIKLINDFMLYLNILESFNLYIFKYNSIQMTLYFFNFD